MEPVEPFSFLSDQMKKKKKKKQSGHARLAINYKLVLEPVIQVKCLLSRVAHINWLQTNYMSGMHCN